MMVFFLFTGIFSVPMDVLITDNEQQEPEEVLPSCQRRHSRLNGCQSSLNKHGTRQEMRLFASCQSLEDCHELDSGLYVPAS
jgi:hypothetical protein